MTALVYLFLITFINYSSCDQDPKYGTTLISDNCERDHQCIENAFCRVQRTCLCEPYYSPTPDKSMCLAIAGLSCNDDTKCQTMTNAECRQGVCACKDNFFLDINNSSNCIGRPVAIGDPCQVNEVCQDSFERSLCTNGKCHCFTGHHYTNDTKTCIQSRGLYFSCTKNYECYLDDVSPDILECSKNNECICKEGEPRCAKGSLLIATGVLMTISFLIPQIA